MSRQRRKWPKGYKDMTSQQRLRAWKRKAVPKWTPRYSGKQSAPFWSTVWRYNKTDHMTFDLLYDLGCAIQKLETKIQHAVEAAEPGRIANAKRRKKAGRRKACADQGGEKGHGRRIPKPPLGSRAAP